MEWLGLLSCDLYSCGEYLLYVVETVHVLSYLGVVSERIFLDLSCIYLLIMTPSPFVIIRSDPIQYS